MLIATWNVNSIRTRLSQIIDWINQVNPDVLCLQETKVIDDSFPVEPFQKLGYSVEIYGQKSYNGVALSLIHISEPTRRVVTRMPSSA